MEHRRRGDLKALVFMRFLMPCIHIIVIVITSGFVFLFDSLNLNQLRVGEMQRT